MRNRDRKEKRENRKVSAGRRMKEHKTGFDSRPYKLPPGVEEFNPKKPGKFKFNIVPFEAGKYNPFAKKGHPYYERTYYCHARIGVANDTRFCLLKMYKLPCCICKHASNLATSEEGYEENKKEIRSCNARERQIFLQHHLGVEDSNKLKVWDVSFHLFGKHLDQKIQDADDKEKEAYDQFADPEEGLVVKVSGTQEKGEGYTWLEFSNIEFKDREKPIPKSILKQVFSVDNMIDPKLEEGEKLSDWAKEYDKETAKLFFGEEGDPSKKKKGKKSEDDDDDKDFDDENDDEEDDEEDNEDDDEEEQQEYAKGDLVKFVYRGKTIKGRIKKKNQADSLYTIHNKKDGRDHVIDYQDETLQLIKAASF